MFARHHRANVGLVTTRYCDKDGRQNQSETFEERNTQRHSTKSDMGPGLAIKSNQAAVNPQPINSNQLHLQSHRRLPVRLSRFAIRKLRRHPRLFRVPLSPMNIAVVVLA